MGLERLMRDSFVAGLGALMLVAGCGGSGTSGAVSGADAGQRVAPDSAGSIDTGGAEDAGAEVAEKDVAEDAPSCPGCGARFE